MILKCFSENEWKENLKRIANFLSSLALVVAGSSWNLRENYMELFFKGVCFIRHSDKCESLKCLTRKQKKNRRKNKESIYLMGLKWNQQASKKLGTQCAICSSAVYVAGSLLL